MKKAAVLALAILLVVGAGLGAGYFLNKHNNAGLASEEKAASLALDATKTYQFDTYKNGILAYSGDALTYYDMKLDQKWEVPKSSQNAVLRVAGNYILLTDFDTNEVKILSSGKDTVTTKSEETIISASVNASGYYAVVSDEKGYKSKVSVYTNKGELAYQWFSGERYIVDAAVSPDNSKLVCCALDLTEGDIKGAVIFLDFAKQEPTYVYEERENAISMVKYAGGQVYALGDRGITVFRPNGKTVWSKSFAENSLQQADIADNGSVVLALAEGGQTVVSTYDKSGKQKGSYGLNDKITLFSVQSGFTAINKGSEIVLLNTKGQEVGFLAPTKDVKEIMLFPNRNKALLVSAISAEVARFE